MSAAECAGELNIPRDSTTDISTSVTVACHQTSSLLSQPEVRLYDVCNKYFLPELKETTVSCRHCIVVI